MWNFYSSSASTVAATAAAHTHTIFGRIDNQFSNSIRFVEGAHGLHILTSSSSSSSSPSFPSLDRWDSFGKDRIAHEPHWQVQDVARAFHRCFRREIAERNEWNSSVLSSFLCRSHNVCLLCFGQMLTIQRHSILHRTECRFGNGRTYLLAIGTCDWVSVREIVCNRFEASADKATSSFSLSRIHSVICRIENCLFCDLIKGFRPNFIRINVCDVTEQQTAIHRSLHCSPTRIKRKNKINFETHMQTGAIIIIIIIRHQHRTKCFYSSVSFRSFSVFGFFVSFSRLPRHSPDVRLLAIFRLATQTHESCTAHVCVRVCLHCTAYSAAQRIDKRYNEIAAVRRSTHHYQCNVWVIRLYCERVSLVLFAIVVDLTAGCRTFYKPVYSLWFVSNG